MENSNLLHHYERLNPAFCRLHGFICQTAQTSQTKRFSFHLCPLCLQGPFSCWKAPCCVLASWTAWGRSFKAPTRFGGIPMPPRTPTDHGSASWSTSRHPPLRTRVETDILRWCARNGRPKSFWCPRSLASSFTTSLSHPLCWELTWSPSITACAWPASALMDTSWHLGMT